MNNLMVLTNTDQIIEATIDSQPVSVPISVTAGAYKMTVDPDIMKQGEETAVTFTFTQGGLTVPQGTSVAFTAVNSDAFANLPTDATTTNANGKITVSKLMVRANTDQIIEASIGGQTVDVPISVTAGAYDMTVEPSTMKQGKETEVTFTFTQGGLTVPENTSVTFTANDAFQTLPADETTNASGQIVIDDLIVTGYTEQTINAEIDGRTLSETIAVTPLEFSLGEISVTGGGDFISTGKSTATLTLPILADGQPYTTPTAVSWRVLRVDTSKNEGVTAPYKTRSNGLSWGDSPPPASNWFYNDIVLGGTNPLRENNAVCKSAAGDNDFIGCTYSEASGNACCPYSDNGQASARLTDIIGERTVVVQATVELNGKTLIAEKDFIFRAGPLSQFRIATSGPKISPSYSALVGGNSVTYQIGTATWRNAAALCSGRPAGNFADNTNAGASNLPSVAQLQALARLGNTIYVAGWPATSIFTNEAYADPARPQELVTMVYMASSGLTSRYTTKGVVEIPFVCRRRSGL